MNINIDPCKKSISQVIFYWCALAYLAILPISNTTALRNLLLFILVWFVVFFISFRRDRLEIDLSTGVGQLPWALITWALFLCLFPLWAVQSGVAWHNLGGQWVQSILAWIVGIAAVLILGRHGPSLWVLAMASAFLVGVHLLLFVMAWSGILGSNVPADMSATAVWAALAHTLDFSSTSTSTWRWQPFPWGFRGLDPMHGNLGYTACQAIALFAVCFYLAWRDKIQARVWSAALGILLCFISILVANSRGAVLFGFFVLITTALISFFRFKNANPLTPVTEKKIRGSIFNLAMFALFSLVVFAVAQSVKHDVRWHTMFDKVKIGLLTEHPLDFLCNGVSSEMESKIRQSFSDREPAYADDLISGLKNQDGGRILLMRAGLILVLENPRGLDGSRHSYQKLSEEKCGHPPVLQFSHSHQGWIDTALALGWLGALIFAWLMLHFLHSGWKNLKNPVLRPWAFALLLMSAFWILRGFADSVYREHYLQMQAFVLGYLYWRMKLLPEAPKETRG